MIGRYGVCSSIGRCASPNASAIEARSSWRTLIITSVDFSLFSLEVALMNRKLSLTRCLGLLVASLAAPAWAASVTLPYGVQQFNTNTNNVAVSYPEFTATGASSSSLVQGGVLKLGNTTTLKVTPNPMPAGTINVDFDGGNTSTSTQVNLAVGNNNVIFHAGHDPGGPTQGAFRVEGPGGIPNNQAMSFLPLINTMYHVHVELGAAGANTVTISDPSNASNVYTNSWNNAGARGDIGFVWGFGVGMYDNFSITAGVPEPTSIALFASMAGVLVKLNRSKWGTLRRSNV